MAERPAAKRREARELQPTDIDQKLTLLMRRTEAANRAATKERIRHTEPSSTPVPQPTSSNTLAAPQPRSPRPTVPQRRPNHNLHEADHDEFSRRLKISSPSPTPHQHKSSHKLYDPQAPDHPQIVSRARTSEPEAMSEVSSSNPPRHPTQSSPRARGGDASQSRQLFDYRKDDPITFSVLARPPRPLPTPKSSGDYVSASSTSSYANSVSSSTFTLSSTTDGSSASSALFDRPNGGSRGEEGSSALSLQLKKLYRAITHLETKIKTEDIEDEEGMTRKDAKVTLKGKQPEGAASSEEDAEREKWNTAIENHKLLAEYIHNLLTLSLSPTVPASLRNIPTKYNIIVRMWTYAFHKLLEALRRASFSSIVAFERLQDFIYFAYGFYTCLLEQPTLVGFKSSWLEALGDLARYRMAVSAMINGITTTNNPGRRLTTKDVKEVQPLEKDIEMVKKSSASISDKPAAELNEDYAPSVGIIAARNLEVLPEPELWRRVAREWYGLGLAEQPGTGKLHHHLGLLCREAEGEELRGIYHFVKSMTTLHPFPTSRESVLPMWSTAAQTRRAQSDNIAPRDLFVLLHGMLFTHVQMDDFVPTLAKFLEQLEMEQVPEKEWMQMAIINIGSIFEYGRPGAVLGRQAAKEASNTTIVITKPTLNSTTHNDERMDIDEPRKRSPLISLAHAQHASPANSETEMDDNSEHSPAFKYALQLTFQTLSYVLRHHKLKSATTYGDSTINPYLTVTLTFLATALKNPQVSSALEKSIPWDDLAAFFQAEIPKRVLSKQGLFAVADKDLGPRWAMLTSGCAPPLPEDWCMRGMEWVGRSVFERGYWKSGEDRRSELETLEERPTVEVTDGMIEDDDDDKERSSKTDGTSKRWIRIVRSAVGIANLVDGFTWIEGTREWRVEGRLAEKVRNWKEQERIEQEAEERRRRGTQWVDDEMEIDEGESFGSEEEDDDENDSEEVKELKARRRYLQTLLRSEASLSTSPPNSRTRVRRQGSTRAALPIVAGYTVLVIDTNLLLSDLTLFASVVESLRWTVIVPLPVIMELDGLSSNASPQLAEAAQSALSYITSHIRSHSLSLKVQTSKGNYLSSLSIRTEQVDFAHNDNNWDRNMDDLILKAAIWQEEHWLDRSGFLKATPIPAHELSRIVKVVLLSLDRNLRLKARSKRLPAAAEKDLANIFAQA